VVDESELSDEERARLVRERGEELR
jgi:hypothetical protein